MIGNNGNDGIQSLCTCDGAMVCKIRMKVEKVVAGGELNNINSSGEKIFDGHSNRAMVCKIE